MFIHETRVQSLDYEHYSDGMSDAKLRSNSQGLDYIAECDLTASGVFNPEAVGQLELVRALRRFQAAGEDLNRFKKALFRKQTRLEAQLPAGFDGPNLEKFRAVGHDDLFHGVIGVATEAGEMAEHLADVIEGKARPWIDNMREEGGDILWYLTRVFKWADTSFLAEMRRNIAKLRQRHGTAGFNKERDMNRDLDAESKILKGEG
jgi:NTP pyrophosphatase (non-canonical NTP hydrolase)